MWDGVSCGDCRWNTVTNRGWRWRRGDGLDSVRIILRKSAAHLKPGGILIVEVGNTERTLRRALRRPIHLAEL